MSIPQTVLPTLSLVVPTFNSENYIEVSLAEMNLALRGLNEPTEIIVVDDGSTDSTWTVLKNFANCSANCNLVAVRLQSNSGQHAATLCGMRISRGSIVVTIDDDLQNNPSEILPALTKLNVFSSEALLVAYEAQEKTNLRKIGSLLTACVVRFIFGGPPDLKLSPFRIMTRPMVDQICRSTNPQPYITGEILLASGSVTNIAGTHRARVAGKSRYKLSKLLNLLAQLTFGYSTKPLTWITGVSLASSILFLVLVVMLLLVRVIGFRQLPGWSSQILLVTTFATLNFLVLSVLGVYLRQLLLRISQEKQYSVIETTDMDR